MAKNSAITSPLLTLAHFIGLIAASLTVILYSVLLFFNPYTNQPATAETHWIAVIMILLALLVGWASLKYMPVLIFLAFLASFFPVGLYMLGTPGLFRAIGVGNLLYLMAVILMVIYRKK
ncbi:MAG: hypothetical protein HYR94_02545 [Chloroflexi bacterium]|nr:hypothetical protein [Chloroflexota bacterium]